MIMQKERITPKRFEISYSGDLSTPRRFNRAYTARSMWFHVVYNIECDTEDNRQAKVSRAAELTHEILRHGADAAQIAPVSRKSP